MAVGVGVDVGVGVAVGVGVEEGVCDGEGLVLVAVAAELPGTTTEPTLGLVDVVGAGDPLPLTVVAVDGESPWLRLRTSATTMTTSSTPPPISSAGVARRCAGSAPRCPTLGAVGGLGALIVAFGVVRSNGCI